MYNFLKKTALLLLITVASPAQESCPIKFQFHDAGVPQWLDRESLLEGLKSKGSTAEQDPLLERLIEYSNRQDCTKATLKKTSFDLEQSIHEQSFVNKKSFNCQNAARQLNQIEELRGGGKVIIVRGSRRILFAHVGEKSFCVQSSAFDGKRLNDNKLQKLYNRLFGRYIKRKLEEIETIN